MFEVASSSYGVESKGFRRSKPNLNKSSNKTHKVEALGLSPPKNKNLPPALQGRDPIFKRGTETPTNVIKGALAGQYNGGGHLFSYNEIKDHKKTLTSLRKKVH